MFLSMTKSLALVLFSTTMTLALEGHGFFKHLPAKSVSGSKILEFRLNHCTLNRSQCIQIVADQATGSAFRQLIFFRAPKIVWTGKSEPTRFDDGYLDLDLNRIVLRKKNQLDSIYRLDNLIRSEI